MYIYIHTCKWPLKPTPTPMFIWSEPVQHNDVTRLPKDGHAVPVQGFPGVRWGKAEGVSA